MTPVFSILRPEWQQFVPSWRQPSVLVLEGQASLSGALHQLYRIQSQCSGTIGEETSSTAQTYRRDGSVETPGLTCRTCVSVGAAMEFIRTAGPVGGVLDLRTKAAECLTLLRHLSLASLTVPCIAVGEPHHEELVPVLLESGCSAVLTRPPVIQDIADFLARCSQGGR